MDHTITFAAFVSFVILLSSWLGMPKEFDVKPEGGIGQRRS